MLRPFGPSRYCAIAGVTVPLTDLNVYKSLFSKPLSPSALSFHLLASPWELTPAAVLKN